ncbi:MAG: DUF2442 domain-containing protein [Arcanobacterium sp.]
MFHKIKNVYSSTNMTLTVEFVEGVTKKYDVKRLLKDFPVFAELKDDALFASVKVDTGGYGIVWSEDLDLSCDELWENGKLIPTPFDGLISFADTSKL